MLPHPPFPRSEIIMAISRLAGSTALLLALGTSVAQADVTPEEVWQNWQDSSAAMGQTLTAASATRDGDTLLVEGIEISATDPEVSVSGTIDQISFTDNGDGTVEVTLSDSYDIDMTFPAAEGVEGATESSITLTISHPGLVTTASGTAAATSYEFAGPSLSVALTSIEGVNAEVVDATAEIKITELSGTYLVEGDAEARAIASSFAAKGLAVNVAGTDTSTGSDVKIVASMADVSSSSTGNFLAPEMMEDMVAALAAGFSLDMDFAYGTTSYDVAVTEAGAPTTIKGGAAGGEFSFGMNGTRMEYASTGKAIELAVSSPEIPFPEVKLSYAESAFHFLMPIAKSDTPADFAALVKIVDLAISEDIWGMIDPGAALPHDPATLVIDTKGTATVTTDIMNEAEMAALGEAPPGMLNSFELTELHAKIAGAELTGSGSLTFDNSDLETFGGVPAPTGKLDLMLLGGNTLLDKLVAMGILTEDDAMGARMGVAMLANSDPAEDKLTTVLEFKDKGFYANGQQLQ
jgi:hypothetical protein